MSEAFLIHYVIMGILALVVARRNKRLSKENKELKKELERYKPRTPKYAAGGDMDSIRPGTPIF